MHNKCSIIDLTDNLHGESFSLPNYCLPRIRFRVSVRASPHRGAVNWVSAWLLGKLWTYQNPGVEIDNRRRQYEVFENVGSVAIERNRLLVKMSLSSQMASLADCLAAIENAKSNNAASLGNSSLAMIRVVNGGAPTLTQSGTIRSFQVEALLQGPATN
jgi:hypothetical protein